ncbi:hypothetical protein Tco_0986348 [Tanacetum coccineum]
MEQPTLLQGWERAPPSPDYVTGPEYPPLPDFVPEPIYPEFMTPEDEVLLAEEYPLPIAASTTANSPGYVPESDPEENPEEDDKEDPEEDPTNGGDDGDDEDESSDDDEDDDVDIEGDKEEEEDHPAPAGFTAITLPAVDQTPSAEETEPFETDKYVATPPPHPAYRITARISIKDETPISLPTSLGTPLLLPIPLPTSSPPLHLLSTDHRADRPEVTLPPRKRLGIALGPRYEVRESLSFTAARPTGGLRADYGFVATMDREIMRDLERDVDYGITDTWDEMLVDMPGVPATDDMELGRRMIEFTTRVRQDTDEIYTRLMKAEARISREAWGRSMDASDLARAEATIKEMLAANRRRQKQFIEALKLLKRLQTQMTEFERQQGPAKGPALSRCIQKEAQKELPVYLNGLKEWSLFSTSAIVQLRIKSSLLLKLEMEIWDLKVKGTDLTSYTQRFQELALLCGRMFLEESDKIEKYVGGLPDMIHGSVVASKPKIMQDAVEIATELMDKKIRTFADSQTESKRKFEDTSRNT